MAYENFENSRDASAALRRRRAAERARKERRKKLMIRRTIIVIVGALILALAIFIVVSLAKLIFNIGGSGETKRRSNSVYSVDGATESATEGATQAGSSTQDPLSFVTPNIKDTGSDGYYSSYGGVYILNNMALELCGGSDSSAKYYAEMISEFKEKAPEYTVYNMVVPNHAEFAIPKRLIENGNVSTCDQAENIKKIYSSYTADVKPINCYNKLAEHIDEYIYFNTDHHWSGLGAYYAYQAFCEQTGQEALDLDDCEERTIPDFQGTLATYDDSVMNNLDTVHFWMFPYQTHARRQDNPGEDLYETTVYYEQEPSGLYSYGVFIWGDAPLFIAYNDELHNGKKIAVIKESYGNSLAPYLTYNYEEVHVIDPRTFVGNLKSYMQDNDIDEVLFINNIMAANTGDFLDIISSIF